MQLMSEQLCEIIALLEQTVRYPPPSRPCASPNFFYLFFVIFQSKCWESGWNPQVRRTLGEASSELYRLVVKFRVDGILQSGKFNVPIRGGHCSLACTWTTATDRRPSPSGANSERAERLEPGSHQRSAQRSDARLTELWAGQLKRDNLLNISVGNNI